MNQNQNPDQEKIIDFKKIGAIIQKNIRVLVRDKARLLPLTIFPIVMILVFGYASGNIPKHISTAIIAYDNAALSQEIQQEIASSQVFAIQHVISTEGEGRNLLDSGEVKVLIEIPPHLQSDIENGVQTGITIIVDESDSAVGTTAKQTLHGIVNQISAEISAQKLSSFQQSVWIAAQHMQAYSNQQIDQYDVIASKLHPVETALSKAKKITDSDIKSLINSIGPNSLFMPPSSYDYQVINTNYTYVIEPAGSTATQAQISALRQSSQLIGAAATTVHTIASIASQTGKQVQSLQELYPQNVLKPLSEIHIFTGYNANSLLQPLLYEEKPAYGTGKRTVDFLIPSIIALTIFQGAIMGMGRAIAGEKKEGSLTRVFLTPTSNVTIIIGTLSFYVLFELFRSAFIILISMLVFNIKIEGSLFAVGLILVIYAGVSTTLGLILSSMVKTEQQFMAMAMLVTMPSMFLSGALFPIQAMPQFMQSIATFLPVTYGGDALRGVMIKGFSLGMIAYPLFILLCFLAFALGIVFMVFKRDIE